MYSKTATSACTALLFAALATSALAQDQVVYEVEVTNVTRGQTFTPILLASHEAGVRIFEAGEPASEELEILAEGGAVGPLNMSLLSSSSVHTTTESAAPLPAGESVTLEIETQGAFDHLSLAAMLVPTNDAFFGLTDVAGPKGDKTIVLYSPAYDAGTEPNTEDCDDIPAGGPCEFDPDNGYDPDQNGEEYVHIHAGIHGTGDLMPSDHDWRNPVAQIRISRVPSAF